MESCLAALPWTFSEEPINRIYEEEHNIQNFANSFWSHLPQQISSYDSRMHGYYLSLLGIDFWCKCSGEEYIIELRPRISGIGLIAFLEIDVLEFRLCFAKKSQPSFMSYGWKIDDSKVISLQYFVPEKVSEIEMT